jgi:LuxR family transcriptional regulator, maltose regulon positive regulatory protein
MTTPLQRTKLFAPAARARLVDRPRLMERLDAVYSPGSKAVIISAPAGSGKTTLANQWLASQTALAAGWVSLDERDNRPALFFSYLIAAVQTILPGTGSESLALLQLPGANLEEVVTLLVNDLSNLPGTFVLALDDFHTITNPDLLLAIDFLLEAQPSQVCLFILTREDPALQLARRRARGELIELRQDDLRFTLPEAVAYFNHCMSLTLSTGQVEVLETRTEGWIAGLQMAALSLQHTFDIERFISEFSGSHRFILDYLMEEVFSNQPQAIQRFLLETAVLERMCAGLCAAITGSTVREAQNHLEYLARANLFVFALDDRRHWYRYHHLFRDLLLARLQWEEPELAAGLYRKASDWYEEHNDAHLAVEYAFKSMDLSHTADLIELHLSDHWQSADLEFMLLINRLPAEVVLDRPTLCVQSAWMCVITGQTKRILPFVAAAERKMAQVNLKSASDDDANRAFLKILRAYLADFENRSVQLDDSLEDAYSAIPESSTGMRNSVAVVLGTLHYMNGNFTRAMHYYQDALERDKRVGGTNAVPICVLRMVWVLQKQGRLRDAFERITINEAYVRQRGNRRFYISGVLNLLWAEILIEWNRLDEAEIQLREGLQLLEDWPMPQVFSMGYSLLARLRTAQHRLPDAREAVFVAEDFLRHNDFHPEFVYGLERAQIQLWSAEQNHAALQAFVRAADPEDESKLYFRYEARLITLGRARLALGQHEAATALLARLSQATGERAGSRIAILALLAAAYASEPALAEVYLDEALRLGEPEGYLRTFVDAGEPLRQTLRAWLHHHNEDFPGRDYASKILQAFDQSDPISTANATASLVETLSRREQEVLQYVAQGLTNQQIADQLVISIRTVKKHIENIHGKLGVKNRTQAAARARMLRLLDS